MLGISTDYLPNAVTKLQNPDFLNVIDNCDFILLSEIGNCTDLEITGYKSFVQCSTPTNREKVVGTLEE